MIYFGKEGIMTKCVGCGAILQDEFPDKEGYTRNLDNKFCERCFNIKHYNKYLRVTDKDYSKIIEDIDAKGDLILLVTDFLNLYNLNDLNLSSPVILVMTKADLLPRSVNKEHLLSSIKCKAVCKIMVSSKNNYNLDELYDKILKYKKTNNVYVIGYTNAGKSTLVNKFLKNYGEGVGEITVSNLPSTTLGVIENKVNDDFTLIDTPGLLDKGSMVLSVSSDVLKKITPRKEIRPISYQIKGFQSLLIEDFMRLDLEDTNIICYMSNDLDYRRAYSKKQCDLIRHEINVSRDSDLVIKGLGFITFKKDSHIILWLKDNISFLIRSSII